MYKQLKVFVFSLTVISSFSLANASGVLGYCSCVDNNGPDLVLIVADANNGATLWNRVLQGWDKSDANWATCRDLQHRSVSCGLISESTSVITYCSCVDNNGPDLVLNVADASNGAALWNRVLRGWDKSDANWALCRELQAASPSCRPHQ